jgi:hypothetical protein
MNGQGDFFSDRPDLDAFFASDEEPYPYPNPERRAIVDRFWVFHEENPVVYEELLAVTRRVQDAGWAGWSVDAAYQVVRFSRITTRSADELKLNNDFRALYARLIMYRNPDLRGFFRIRRRRSA